MVRREVSTLLKVWLLLLSSACLGAALPAPRIVVAPGIHAPAVEQFAARELSRYLEALFGIRAGGAAEAPGKQPVYTFWIGTPATNPAVASRLPSGFRRLSDQGIFLQSLPGGNGLLVGGGSPPATLWAVYELVELWGVRYLLHGDVMPKPSQFRPPDLSIGKEPVFRIRQWRVVNELAVGPASWGMADYRPVLDQLAKLKFNRILAYIWPQQPFLDYASGGIQRSTSSMFFGFHFPITGDMPGRKLFGSAKEFHNPDLPVDGGYASTYRAARRHLRALMSYAGDRGMSCVLGLTASEFPPEFAPLFADPQRVRQVGEQTIVPGSKTPPDDPALSHLALAVLDSAVRTYPLAEYLDLGMQEWRQWTGEYRRAWDALDRKYALGGTRVLNAILEQARNRKNYYGAGRAEAEVKGDLVSIYFYDRLLSNRGGLSRRPKFVLDSVAEELFPYLSRMAPWTSETLNSVDYTPARILRRRETLGRLGAGRLPAALIYTLHDDNVGVLPQLETGALHALNTELRHSGWSGFSTRYWLIGDHDPCVAYLAKAAWNDTATPEAVYRDQLRAVCGDGCVAPMLSALEELEQATREMELHALGLAFPVPGMAMKFWKPGPLPPQFSVTRQHYANALKQVEAAKSRASGNHNDYLNYYEGRFQFGIRYFEMIGAINQGATAEAAGDKPAARQAARKALELARDAIDCYARVARDQSDRGTIAVLAEYVYRPLKQKVEELGGEPPR